MEKRAVYEKFKMACLQYRPTEINVQNKIMMTRKEALIQRAQLLRRMTVFTNLDAFGDLSCLQINELLFEKPNTVAVA